MHAFCVQKIFKLLLQKKCLDLLPCALAMKPVVLKLMVTTQAAMQRKIFTSGLYSWPE